MATDQELGSGESPRIATRVVVVSALGIFAVLIVIAFGFQLLFSDRIGRAFVDRHDFPAPAVVSNEKAQRLALEAEQNRALEGAGGRMPIDAAMRMIARKGSRAFEPVDTPP